MQKAPKWSDRYIGGLKYIFGILLSDNSIREEIGLNSRETIKEKNLDPQEIINRLYKICDEYSRGGLSYIEELLEEDNQIFLDPFSFKDIIENANYFNPNCDLEFLCSWNSHKKIYKNGL